MFKPVILLNLFLMTILACSGNEKRTAAYPFKYFSVSIEQDGIPVSIENSRVSLEKGPFTIIISFTDSYSIFVNASFDPAIFDAAGNKVPVKDLGGFKVNETPGALFDPDNELLISNEYPNFWNYTGEEEHHFTSVEKINGILKCSRTVSTIYDAAGTKKPVKISDIKQNNIYFVFMKLEWNEDFSSKNELKRFLLHVNFN